MLQSYLIKLWRAVDGRYVFYLGFLCYFIPFSITTRNNQLKNVTSNDFSFLKNQKKIIVMNDIIIHVIIILIKNYCLYNLSLLLIKGSNFEACHRKQTSFQCLSSRTKQFIKLMLFWFWMFSRLREILSVSCVALLQMILSPLPGLLRL